MNKLFLSLAVVALAALTSCEKCADCSCDLTYEFDFSDSISTASQDEIETAYEIEYAEQYPANNVEICEKKKDLDGAIADYEGDTKSLDENNQAEGHPWSIEGDYICTCVKQD